MKKLLILGVILFFPLKVSALSAQNIVAMDMDTHRTLYEKNAHNPHLIASISKIMTCIVAIELADLESEVTPTTTILKSFGSGIYIEVGEKIKLKDLLYGLMLRSGNDAALAISEYVGGTVDNFVKLMNEKAKSLGMNNTTFINPHGLENKEGKGNMSTAYDMALLSSYAMQNETYRNIVSTKNYKATSSTKTYSWTNKNKLLTMYEYTTGGKTGFTEKARRTLVSTAQKGDKNITIVTLNDPDDWQDHKNLYETLFKEYKRVKVVSKDQFKIENETYYKQEELYIKEDIYVLVNDLEKNAISIAYELNKIPNYKNDTKVGTIKIKLKDQVIKEEDIFVRKKEATKKTTFWQKILGWLKHD